jgi:hypothetical protein
MRASNNARPLYGADEGADQVAATRPTKLEVFELRCWARARLYAEGEYDLHEAVDVLQADAERDGLVDEIGQDKVQSILGKEFGRVRHA